MPATVRLYRLPGFAPWVGNRLPRPADPAAWKTPFKGGVPFPA